MRRVRPLFASLAVVAVLAAGCTDATKPIEPTDSPPSSSAPTVDPPELPDAAKEESAEGASSFVDYYLAVLTYAAQTGDTSLLASLSASTCDGCDAYVNQFASRHEAGGWRKDGNWTAGSITVSTFGRDLALVAELNAAAGTYKEDAESEVRAFEASSEIVTFVVGFEGTAWSVIEFTAGDLT